jgi:hypothetical protein
MQRAFQPPRRHPLRAGRSRLLPLEAVAESASAFRDDLRQFMIAFAGGLVFFGTFLA